MPSTAVLIVYRVLDHDATLSQGDCWICMELMNASLDQFYKFVYKKLEGRIPEQMLSKISITVWSFSDWALSA